MHNVWHGTCSIYNKNRRKNSKENITMKKLVMTLVAVIAVTALAVSVFAFGPGSGRGYGGGSWYGGDVTALSGLNVTAEQTAKINALREAHLKDVKPLQDKMFSKRGDLRLLWLHQNPDQEKIIALQKEIRTMRDQMQDKRDTYRLKVFNVLTPEQQSQYKAYGPGRGFGPGMRGGYNGRGPGMGGGAGWQGGPCNYGDGPGPGMMRGNW
jgi:Spy/CpxP family protein refolding chaperone